MNRCWRRGWDSNPRLSFPNTRFPSVLLKPLGHLSVEPADDRTPPRASQRAAPSGVQGIGCKIQEQRRPPACTGFPQMDAQGKSRILSILGNFSGGPQHFVERALTASDRGGVECRGSGHGRAGRRRDAGEPTHRTRTTDPVRIQSSDRGRGPHGLALQGLFLLEHSNFGPAGRPPAPDRKGAQ